MGRYPEATKCYDRASKLDTFDEDSIISEI